MVLLLIFFIGVIKSEVCTKKAAPVDNCVDKIYAILKFFIELILNFYFFLLKMSLDKPNIIYI